MLSGRGLCDELITRPGESYRLCCIVVCDLETSIVGAPYIYDIRYLRVNITSSTSRSLKYHLPFTFPPLIFLFLTASIFHTCPRYYVYLETFSPIILSEVCFLMMKLFIMHYSAFSCSLLFITSSLLSLPFPFRILPLSLHAHIILLYLPLMYDIHRLATCQAVICRPVNAKGRVR